MCELYGWLSSMYCLPTFVWLYIIVALKNTNLQLFGLYLSSALLVQGVIKLCQEVDAQAKYFDCILLNSSFFWPIHIVLWHLLCVKCNLYRYPLKTKWHFLWNKKKQKNICIIPRKNFPGPGTFLPDQWNKLTR